MHTRLRPAREPGRQQLVTLCLILMAGLGARLWLAMQDPVFLLGKNLPDDAYYYFSLARSLAAGLGPVADGKNPSNGFHPLWLLLITPLFRLAGPSSEALPIQLSLVLCAVIDFGSGLLLGLVVRRVTGRTWAAVLAAALYLLNPVGILRSVSGMESALSTFLVAAVVTWYTFRIGRGRVSLGRYAILGLLSGLLVLARTDSVLILIALAGFYLVRRRNREAWLQSTVWAGSAILIVLPWWAWSQMRFGTVVQVSALAYPYLLHAKVAEAAGGSAIVYLRSVAVVTLAFAVTVLMLFPGLPLLAYAAVLVRRGAAANAIGLRRRGWRYAVWLLPPSVGLLLLAVVHTWVRWYPRDHYFLPIAWLGAAALALILDLLVRCSDRRRPQALFIVVGTFALFMVAGMVGWRNGAYVWQPEMYRAGRWLARNTGLDERTGSFNSGILRYYSGRTVVNLDGVVNPEAFRALQARRLAYYVREHEIRYLVDFPDNIDQYTGFWGEPLAWRRISTDFLVSPSPGSQIEIYKR